MKRYFVLVCSLSLLALIARAQTVLTIDLNQKGPQISPMLYGLFFEEINHAGDGGLYAELIRNRSFEDDAQKPDSWATVGNSTAELITEKLLNKAQKHALRLTSLPGSTKDASSGIENTGFWGIHAVKGRTYQLSFFVRSLSGYKGTLTAQLVSEDGRPCASQTIKGINNKWRKVSVALTATSDNPQARFRLLMNQKGSIDLDVVSLFPPTFKGRKNGLRKDLAEMLEAVRPAFIRFPGGCYVEGAGKYENAFRWRTTLGPIEQRPGHANLIWGYRSSDGLGFDEYLQMCEDLKAAPLFVVNIGLGHGYFIPVDSLKPYIDDMLNAIEYANGPTSTPMGKLRAKNGHPLPYNIQYVELGNENYQAGDDPQSLDYAERYRQFREALVTRYPSIKVIGNVEAWGTENPSWRNPYPVDFLDEHYYRSYDWMRNNFTKYDSYPRGKHKVYNGEYAANERGTYGHNGTIQSALGEAIYMMGMERNGDVCEMSSFAPIFTHESNRAWDYDMIHFTASQSFGTPSYYVQQLFSNHVGRQGLVVTEQNNLSKPVVGIKAGLGTWRTKAEFSNFAILSGEGTFLAKDTESNTSNSWEAHIGKWQRHNRSYQQTDDKENCTSVFSQTIPTNCYEVNVTARKQSGAEGFLILFNYQDEKNYCWWNIGGWENTKNALENCTGGSKATLDSRPFHVEEGHDYQIRIRVDGCHITGWIDGEQALDVTLPQRRAIYSVASLNEKGDSLIVKIVNPEPTPNNVQLNLKNLNPQSATCIQLKSANAKDENTLDEPRKVVPTAPFALQNVGSTMQFEAPANSLNILTIKIAPTAQ